MLGFKEDERNYDNVLKIIEELNISKVILLSNNKNKIKILSKYVIQTINIDGTPNIYNQKYLHTKNINNVKI